MLRMTGFTALLLLLVSTVTALETKNRIEVHAWPLSAATSQPYATIEYDSASATTINVQPLKLAQDEKLVRLGYYRPESNKWAGVVTTSDSFGSEKEQTILVHLDDTGLAYHIGFTTTKATAGSRADSTSSVSAQVVPLHPAPVVHFNKPVVLAADGQVEGPPEKTFLQKYWWAIGLFLVLQLVMGGSDKK